MTISVTVTSSITVIADGRFHWRVAVSAGLLPLPLVSEGIAITHTQAIFAVAAAMERGFDHVEASSQIPQPPTTKDPSS